jgi:type II secretory pathway component PulK
MTPTRKTRSHLRACRRHRRPRGVVLVIVLFVVVILALSAFTFTELMLTHYEGAQNSVKAVQARQLIDSGSETVKMLLLQDEASREESGGLYNNQYSLRGVVVVPDTDPQFRGCFSVLAPVIDEQGMFSGIRFGLEDESTRLNLNFLPAADKLLENGGRTLLMAMPGMTEDVADAIMDWIDEDDEPREFGAEGEYYGTLDPPYYPKNAPLDSVEELLLVRGVTPTMLFGMDLNRNGVIDPHESQATGQTSPTIASLTDPALGDLSRGWSPYLTLYSAEKNVNSLGLPRIDLNSDDLEALYDQLNEVVGAEWATFIVAYRQSGPYDGDEDGEIVAGDLDFSRAGETKLTQVLDLVGAKTEARFAGQSDPVVLGPLFPAELGAMALYMPTLMDNCTASSAGQVIPGRININQAPRAVLLGIPGMTEELADEILDMRPVQGSTSESENLNMLYETWLLTEGLLFNEQGEPDLATMKQLVPFVCAGGDVYRAQVVGYFQGGGASARAEVVFDNTGAVPRVVFWRDLSHLGRGYNLETLGVDLTGQGF